MCEFVCSKCLVMFILCLFVFPAGVNIHTPVSGCVLRFLVFKHNIVPIRFAHLNPLPQATSRPAYAVARPQH